MKVKRLSQVNELISSLMEHPRQAPINVMVICPYQHPSEGFFAGGPFLLPGNLLTFAASWLLPLLAGGPFL
jgi:hypothetical protein